MLPKFFQSSALLDRFHGFIEGWNLVRMNEDLIVKGHTLNVEYFSEILHILRSKSEYSTVVNDLIDIPSGADTRDKKAIVKLATGYLKLIFPHVTSSDKIDPSDFYRYCLTPALSKRKIIKEQRALIDEEVIPDIPDIKLI
jgi:ATP-dependent Lon protease